MDKDLAPDRSEPQSDLVCIFRTGEESLIAIVKSILDGEEIPYLARGADLQDLFGVGLIGAGFNIVVGSVDFLVHRDDVERARAALDAFRQSFMGQDSESEDGQSTEQDL